MSCCFSKWANTVPPAIRVQQNDNPLTLEHMLITNAGLLCDKVLSESHEKVLVQHYQTFSEYKPRDFTASKQHSNVVEIGAKRHRRPGLLFLVVHIVLVASALVVPKELAAQYYVLRAGKLTRVELPAAPTQAPKEWQYWLFPRGSVDGSRSNVAAIIASHTRDSLEMELASIQALHAEYVRETGDSLDVDSLNFEKTFGPVAVYDMRNDYGGLIRQGLRALERFGTDRSAMVDTLHNKVKDVAVRRALGDHTKTLLAAYAAHYRAQCTIDTGVPLRDDRLVRQLDGILNTLSREQRNLWERIARLRPIGRELM